MGFFMCDMDIFVLFLSNNNFVFNRFHLGIALQVTLCDTFLGGLASQVMLPQIKEADAWKDDDGKRHAGCLLDYEVRVHFTRSKTAAEILERSRENGSNE